MFMWMLHDELEKITRYQNVYVNVTWWTWKDSEISKCLCKCYMIKLKR
jgi:hypothetical protein